MAGFEAEGLFPEPKRRPVIHDLGAREIEAELVDRLLQENLDKARGGVALFGLTVSGEMLIPEELL